MTQHSKRREYPGSPSIRFKLTANHYRPIGAVTPDFQWVGTLARPSGTGRQSFKILLRLWRDARRVDRADGRGCSRTAPG